MRIILQNRDKELGQSEEEVPPEAEALADVIAEAFRIYDEDAHTERAEAAARIAEGKSDEDHEGQAEGGS